MAESLPPRVVMAVDGLDRLSFDQLTALALNLYRESAGIIRACARNHEPAKLTDRSQAICCGLLVRLVKYMLCADVVASSLHQSADVLMAINRCMLESAVNVMFLLVKDAPEVYEDFVKKGLGPEREFHDFIQENVAATGRATPMEERMLASIVRVFEHSGVRLEDVPTRHQEWGGNMRSKMEELEWVGLYIGYRTWSHAVHGTWADVVMRHLVYEPDGFELEWMLGSTDSRLFNATAKLNLEAAARYADKWFSEVDKERLFPRIADVIHDLEILSDATEGAIQRERAAESPVDRKQNEAP